MTRLKLQLHLHTRQDPLDSIKYTEKQAIDRAAKLGYDVLAITCHNVIIFNDDLRKYAAKKRILLIPGIEKTIERKHVVILNATIDAQKIHTFDDLAVYKKNHQECFILAPHPFYPGSVSLKKVLKKRPELFDGVEYSFFHTKRLNGCNKKAVATAEKLNLPIIATADCHFINYLDNSYSIINSEKNISSIFAELRSNNIQIISHNLHWWEFFILIPLKLSIGTTIKYLSLR